MAFSAATPKGQRAISFLSRKMASLPRSDKSTFNSPRWQQRVPFLLEMSTDANKNNFEREFTQKQKAMSTQMMMKGNAGASSASSEHAKHQTKVFDEMSSFFASEDAIPEEVVPVLRDMADTMISKAMDLREQGEALNEASRPARASANATYDQGVYHILDVGCGTGALFDFYLQAAQQKGITLHIHGLDLAPKMVEQARAHGEELLTKLPADKHSIRVDVRDITSWSRESDDEPSFDLAVANACFGNFFDRQQALQQMTECLRLDGLLCITHPLGSDFVRKLHEEDSMMVPYLLPTSVKELQQLSRTLPLRVLDIVDKEDGQKDGYYMASAVKVPYATLPQTMRFRGQVATGYGRGGKKLGFPTANLPSGLFQGALQDVPCGVYFGWAVLEDSTNERKGRNIPHKAVVNVGYSPTFEGQENREMIIEAHLMFDSGASPLDPPDFYGEVMRLQLIGFIRSEMKFPSFPDLIAQISTDVEDAKDALDLEMYQEFQKGTFIAAVDESWVGSDGGDEAASWEFQDVEPVLEQL